MAWDYFPDGRYLPIAGLRILHLVEASQRARNTIYSVRMDCCGAEMRMSHAQIRATMRSRTRLKRVKCIVCQPPKKRSNNIKSQARRESDVYVEATNAAMALWDKPDSVPPGHFLSEDRMGRAWLCVK